MVTICTASLTFTILRSAHTAVFMCFVWISEQTATISLYNINWVVIFITETECVYCAVRTGCLYIIQTKILTKILVSQDLIYFICVVLYIATQLQLTNVSYNRLWVRYPMFHAIEVGRIWIFNTSLHFQTNLKEYLHKMGVFFKFPNNFCLTTHTT